MDTSHQPVIFPTPYFSQLEMITSQGYGCGVVVRSYFAAHNHDFTISQRVQARLSSMLYQGLIYLSCSKDCAKLGVKRLDDIDTWALSNAVS